MWNLLHGLFVFTQNYIRVTENSKQNFYTLQAHQVMPSLKFSRARLNSTLSSKFALRYYLLVLNMTLRDSDCNFVILSLILSHFPFGEPETVLDDAMIYVPVGRSSNLSFRFERFCARCTPFGFGTIIVRGPINK